MKNILIIVSGMAATGKTTFVLSMLIQPIFRMSHMRI